jgi:hypothetical protein
MGVRDLPGWAYIAGIVADQSLDIMGAKRCAQKGHKWRDVKMIVETDDGGVVELPRGTAQRCVRCGAAQRQPPA